MMQKMAYVRVLMPDGALEPVPYEAGSLAVAASHEPDGIYTVTNTYNTFQVLKFDAHLDRMEDSARRSGMMLTIDRPRLKAALRRMIAEAGYGDVRFRVTVPAAQPDHYILSLEPFSPLTPAFLQQGVRVITVADSARHNPAAKTTDWMHRRQDIIDNLPPGTYDAILCDAEGHLLEGLGANFYAVLNDELRTAGAGVLPGIAQQIVFEIAPGILPLRREAIHTADLPHLAEAFITSSSRGIVPVVAVDGHLLGDGTPGKHTLTLLGAYKAWEAAHLQDL